MTERDNGSRVSWLGLNAYGIFVGVLVVLVGTRYVFTPTGQMLSGAGHIGYVLSGLALILSYAKARVDIEVTASVALFTSNLLILAGRFLETGFDLYNTALTAALGFLVAARIAALMRGGTFTLPRWER